MTAPVKAITYLTGVFPMAATALPPKTPAMLPRQALWLRQAPPLWKPLYYRDPQPVGRTVLIPKAIYLQALLAIRSTPFWRASPDPILKGQQYP